MTPRGSESSLRLLCRPSDRGSATSGRGRNPHRANSVGSRQCRMWVKLGRTQPEQMSSGLPLKADIARYSRHVSKVPEAAIEPDLRLALAKAALSLVTIH